MSRPLLFFGGGAAQTPQAMRQGAGREPVLGVGYGSHGKLQGMIRAGLARQAPIRRDWPKEMAWPTSQGIGL